MQLCYVTDRKLLSVSHDTEALLQQIVSAGEARVEWIQIREKDLPAREVLEIACRALASVPNATKVIVNDRLDVALASGAAGVHLGAASIPATDAVPWCRAGNAPENFLIGVSCHSLREAMQAEQAGASYIFFGPIYETPSKLQFGPPQGIARLAEVCRSVRIPVFAIGGINAKNARACAETGVAGVAAIRLFQDALDGAELSRIVAKLRKLPGED